MRSRASLCAVSIVVLLGQAAPARAGEAGQALGGLPPELGLGPELGWQDIARQAGPKLEGSPLALSEAIRIALASSPDVRVAGYDPAIALAELEARRGVYEPRAFAAGSAARSLTPAGSALAGATTLDDRMYTFGAGIEQPIPTGGEISIELSNQIEDTNSAFAALDPQYTPELTLSLTQPLLKDLLTDEIRSGIRVARSDLAAAETDVRRRVRDTVFEVERSYWELAFAVEDWRVKDVALKLGERLLANNRLRFQIGVVPETEVIAAAAEAARRRDALVVARLAYRNAEEALRRAAGLDPAGPDILPSDPLAPAPIDRPLSEWLDRARRGREERLAAKARLEGLEEQSRLARNGLLPRLDFVGEAGLNGTAGSAHAVDFRGLTLESPFGGGVADSYEEMLSGDFWSWSAGIELEVPLLWREAAARYRVAVETERRAREDLVRLERDIELEVRTAYNEAESGLARVETTGEALTLSERDLAAEVTRYNVGVSETDDVIRKLSTYSLALTESVRAKAACLEALASLERASGETIERKGIRLAPSGREPTEP